MVYQLNFKHLVFDVIDDHVPTSTIFSIRLPKNSLTARPFLTCSDGKGENLLPALRVYVQERHPDQATSPATNVTGKPS